MHPQDDKNRNRTPPSAGTELPAETLHRRRFMQHVAAVGGAVGLGGVLPACSPVGEPEPLAPIGQAKGIHPGRVVWVHDPQATDWPGPGRGHWLDNNHTRQDRVDEMMSRAVENLTGQPAIAKAWDALFRSLNRARGKGDVGYRRGEKIVIKPNWVGLIYRDRNVNPETYTLVRRPDYMNTSPQMIVALLRQLVGAVGIRPSDISVCDTLAYLVHEYYTILHREFPAVRYVDHAGRFGRSRVQASSVPLYWSCWPEGTATDVLPLGFVQSEYLVNFASLKGHAATGVTLCGKNHFGSLVRWPLEQGYYNMHLGCFSRQTGVYREHVDLMGHAHLGGKTVLYLIDGLYSGIHGIDPAPRKWASPPFGGHWTSSLLASQDPVAIDSVGFDFIRAEWDDFPRRPGVDDYLHEAALADDPPSGTFYDPDHACPTRQLASLGVHEHWNNAQEKKYSRNFGRAGGIELVAVAAQHHAR